MEPKRTRQAVQLAMKDSSAARVARRFQACGCAAAPLDEHLAVSPPGWEKSVEKMKEDHKDEIDNPFALAWWMKDKGYEPHHKEAVRVAARFQRAYEFSSPDALRDYLKQHPDADKSKHTVKKPEHGEPKKEEPHGEKDKAKSDHGGEHHEEKPKRSWKDLVKGLSDKAKSFVEKAPSAVKNFINDESFRRDALMKAHKAITEAPRKFVENAMKEVKHEAKEFKEAGEGVLAVLKGGKMNDHQKKAFKTVATHIAIATAATALTGGLAGGAAALAKGAAANFTSGLAKKVALKAVAEPLGNIPTLEELGHAGHGAVHLFQHFMQHLAAEEPSPEDALKDLIAAAVAKGIKELDADTVAEALEEAANGADEG